MVLTYKKSCFWANGHICAVKSDTKNVKIAATAGGLKLQTALM